MSDNIHILMGSDELRIKKEAEKVAVQIAGADADDFSLDICETGDKTPAETALANAINSIQTPGFMGVTKTVWLKNFPLDNEPPKTDKSSYNRLFTTLLSYLESGIPDDVKLLISAHNPDLRKRFAKAAKKQRLTVFDQPKISDRDWQSKVRPIIQDTAVELGLKLANETLEYLLQIVGVNTGLIRSELEKIQAFVGETNQPLRIADIREISHGHREAEFWAFSTAIGNRDLPEAMISLQRLLGNNKDAAGAIIGILTMAGNTVRQLLQAKLFMQICKCRPEQVPNLLKQPPASVKSRVEKACADLFSMNPWAVKFKAQEAARYSGKELVDAIGIVTDAYVRAVTSQTNPVLLMEQVAIKIITKTP